MTIPLSTALTMSYTVRQATATAGVMKTLLADLVEDGRTVFLSTHTLEIAEQLCSRVAIVQKGLVAALGTLEELRIQAMTEGSLEAVFLRLTEGEPMATEDDLVRPPLRAAQ